MEHIKTEKAYANRPEIFRRVPENLLVSNKRSIVKQEMDGEPSLATRQFDEQIKQEFAGQIPGLKVDVLKKKLADLGFNQISDTSTLDVSSLRTVPITYISSAKYDFRFPGFLGYCQNSWTATWREQDDVVIDIAGHFNRDCTFP